MSILDPPGPHCSRRLFEWAMAAWMVGFGLHCVVSPGTLETSRYNTVVLIVAATHFGAVMAAVGIVRIVTLYQNGNWPNQGPRVRALMSLVSAVICMQLAVALSSLSGKPASPGMWTYSILAGVELWSVWRARREADGPRYQ